jgi:hypothetical protein
MPQLTRFIAAVILLCSLTGCGAPELRPRLILKAEPVGKDFWLDAPYILVVKIINANEQGSPQAIFQGGPKTLQLMRYEVNVENLIKGDLPAKLTFFFFAKLDQKPHYDLLPGGRYIVALRSEGGVLRSWADATQLKIEVHSGSHSQNELPLDRGPETVIAYILLTPGADADLREFRNSLIWSAYGDPAYVNQRLKQLTLSPDPGLRDSACFTIANSFWIRPKCLEQALGSPDSNTRKTAASFLEDNKNDVDVLGLLRTNPTALFPIPPPLVDNSLQKLEIYTEDMRPEVRRAACAALHNVAPQRVAEACK